MDEQTTRPRERLTEAQRLLLRKRLAGAAKPAAPPASAIQRREGGPVQPMSWAQERLWFLDQMEPGNAFYNIPAAALISARVDVALLERAFTEVVRRHEALRTVFRLVDGEPKQIIQPPYPIHAEIEDIRGPGGRPTDEQTIRRRISDEGARPFDLAAGPLLRVKLFRVSDPDYALLINVHHIVTDGWSMPIIMREMEELYDAYSHGRPSPLPELEIQYADYSAWQRGWLAGDTLRRQLEYWHNHMAGAPTLELPTDRPRPPVLSHRGSMYRFVWPGSLADRLRQVSVETGASVNMVIMAGYYLMLRHYSGQDDLVVGTLLGNRNRAQLEPLVGFFVNSAPVRARLSDGMSFRELVRQVRTAVLDADANQDLPFDKMVDELKVARDPARNPLFQVMYFHHTFVRNYHHLEDSEVESDLNIRSLFQETGVSLVDSDAAKFDMTFATMELQGGLANMVEYSTDLWDESAIARMMEHTRVLLERAAADVDAPIGTLSPVTGAERARLLAWGTNERPYPRDAAIHALFAEQAARTPDAVALTFSGASLTYAELDARANAAASALRGMGVGGGTPVGVAVERSAELIVALLAVLKAGGCYVPLDAAYPAERLAFMLEDAGVAALAVGDAVPDALRSFAGPVLVLREVGDAGDAIAPAEVGPESPAYILYTSGSTGTPKGVAVPHRAVVRLVRETDFADLGPDQTILQLAPMAFDASTLEVWGALLNGGRLAIFPPHAPSLEELGAFLREQGVTTAWLTAGLFHQMADAELEALGSLRQLLAGGDVLSVAHVRKVLERHPHLRLINGYGPTENTTFTTTHAVTLADTERPSIPIGRPIANTRVYVLDRHDQPCPVGVPGELCAAGDGLALGYVNRPELTAEKFVTLEIAGRTERVYRTGDRVRWLEDGVLEFLGRLDEQVKVRGFRIEPGEIEAALRGHDAVADCAVVLREDAPGERRLVAYVAGPDAEVLAGADFRAFLRERLPDYMVPTAFVPLDAIPLTPNGKVDRRRLPAPEAPRVSADADAGAPRGEVERVLAEVWADVLRLERVGVHDNFFALGGDSILSIQIIARAAQRGVRVTPKQMFVHQTIAELAAVAGEVPAARAEQGAVTGPAPLTPVQHWFFGQDLPAPHHFNLALAFELRDVADPRLVERAVAAVLAHHDALRTRFRPGPEGWTADVAGVGGPVPFEAIDLSHLPVDRQEGAITERASALQTGLDLEAGPLIRFVLFGLGDERLARLVVIAHHLVVDAVSWGFVAADLETAYRQLARGETVSLPAKTTSFRDWAQRLADHARSDALRGEADFWIARSAPTPPLPRDGDGANTEGDAQRITATLEADDTRALLTEVPPVYGTQVNDALLAALARTFHGWTGQPVARIDLEAHGREDLFADVDVSRTTGWFTAIYPVRLDLSGAEGPGEALKAVKEQLRAVPGKGIGYGLLRWLGDGEARAALAAAPVPEVSFNYLGQFDGGAADETLLIPSDTEVGALRGPGGTRPHLLGIDAAVSGGRLHVTWTFAPAVHRPETVERLAAEYLEELRGLIAHCRDPQAGGYTPSDFALAGLDQEGLDAILAQIG
ncbi:MAG TPA: amino acid adenylation domain-containing protein [Longimicrobium sp.]|nr:amino acid adenylation domain-containing protein [Longimicrobium sp.]